MRLTRFKQRLLEPVSKMGSCSFLKRCKLRLREKGRGLRVAPAIYDGSLTVPAQTVLMVLGLVCWLHFTLAYLPAGSDLAQDYAAAKMLLQGKAVYGPGITDYALRQLGFSGIENFHPPFNALLFIPLAVIPFPYAAVVMNACSLFTWVWLVRRVARSSAFTPLAQRWLLAAALVWHPFLAALGLVQISVFLAAGVYGVWLCLRNERPAAAGCILALLIQIKLFPLLLILYPLLRRDMRAVGWTLLFSAFFTLCMVITMGGSTIAEYAREVMPSNMREWCPFPVNYSLLGILAQFLAPSGWISNAAAASLDVLGRVSLLLSAALAAAVAVLARRLVRAGEDERAFLAIVSASLILSPLCWQHYFTIAMPGLIAASRLTVSSGGRLLPWAWALLVAALFIPDIRLVDYLVELFLPSRIPASVFAFTRLPALYLWAQLFILLLVARRGRDDS